MRNYLKQIILLILLLLTGYQAKDYHTNSTLNTARLPAGQSGDWDLLFSDEFDASSLDSEKWTTCYWWSDEGCTGEGNNELQWYQPDDVQLSDGVLTLRAQERTISSTEGKTYQWTSGMITTGRSSSNRALPAKFVFQYGYAEIRAKVPSGQGLWPAFWMLPETHRSRPEIDVMELLGHEPETIYMHFHYNDDKEERRRTNSRWTGPDFSKEWHTFAVDWQPDAIIWYVDGIERARYRDSQYIPNEPMYLLLNLAVGGDWPGSPDSSTPFPSEYEIDYVRVWKRGGQVYLAPIDDTFVDREHPSTNFGSGKRLYIDAEPVKKAYLKFDSTDLAGKTLRSATLRIQTTRNQGAGSAHRQYIRLITPVTWGEGEVTYNQPVVSSTVVGNLSNTSANTTYDIALDISRLQPHLGNLLTLEIESTGPDGLYIYSKEHGSGHPQLILSTEDEN